MQIFYNFNNDSANKKLSGLSFKLKPRLNETNLYTLHTIYIYIARILIFAHTTVTHSYHFIPILPHEAVSAI